MITVYIVCQLQNMNGRIIAVIILPFILKPIVCLLQLTAASHPSRLASGEWTPPLAVEQRQDPSTWRCFMSWGAGEHVQKLPRKNPRYIAVGESKVLKPKDYHTKIWIRLCVNEYNLQRKLQNSGLGGVTMLWGFGEIYHFHVHFIHLSENKQFWWLLSTNIVESHRPFDPWPWLPALWLPVS